MNEPNKINPPASTNPDPISGAPGAHPVGTGIGAVVAGAAAGAAGGALGGPVGAVVGAVAGAVVGGIAGKATAEAIDPTVETKYWRESYAKRPYVQPNATYEEYAPAYRYGWEHSASHTDQAQAFDKVEPELKRGWANARGQSTLDWDRARPATEDAWNRVRAARSSSSSSAANNPNSTSTGRTGR